jgi:hypothetical protein
MKEQVSHEYERRETIVFVYFNLCVFYAREEDKRYISSYVSASRKFPLQHLTELLISPLWYLCLHPTYTTNINGKNQKVVCLIQFNCFLGL